MKRKDKTPANGDELPIRNSTAEFLIFAKDSGANTEEQNGHAPTPPDDRQRGAS